MSSILLDTSIARLRSILVNIYMSKTSPLAAFHLTALTNHPLDTVSRNARSLILHKSLQEPPTTTLHTLHKSLAHNIRSRRARMRMILRKQLIRLRLPNTLIIICRVSSMIHIKRITPQTRSYILRIRDKPAITV